LREALLPHRGTAAARACCTRLPCENGRKAGRPEALVRVVIWCCMVEVVFDDERTRVKKSKILKSLKKKERFSKLDKQQSDKKSNWQTFLKGKGSKKKKGFITGRKKESIFKTSDGGKVGVTGSGKGVTDFQQRKKHKFSHE